MDVSKYRKIWQHASGDTNRNYHKLCFEWGVILFGPGTWGAHPGCEDALKANGIKKKKRKTLERFAERMQDGDLVVLRIGTGTIYGVGEIVGDYEWNDCFRDVDGWDLQHTRRVRWLWIYDGAPKIFKAYALKWGDTTQKLTGEEVMQWLSELEIPAEKYEQSLKELPEVGKPVTLDELTEYLYARGISNTSISQVQNQFTELRRIAKWYGKEKEKPSEAETIAYLISPMLRALGWTPQKMAVEWHNVDLALFSKLNREDANLSAVVEAKKMGYSCLTAKSQASGYAEGKPNCQRLIVTDGMRYGIYLKENDDFTLMAYFNLSDLRDEYAIFQCGGVKEALTLMTPEWRAELVSGEE